MVLVVVRALIVEVDGLGDTADRRDGPRDEGSEGDVADEVVGDGAEDLVETEGEDSGDAGAEVGEEADEGEEDTEGFHRPLVFPWVQPMLM